MKRKATIAKTRPAHWADGPEIGRHLCTTIDEDLNTVGWGICDLEERGREVFVSWMINGPAPVRMTLKRKYRGK